MNLLWQHKLCNLQQCYKIAVFTYSSPHFCFPWERPWGNHVKCCMDGKTIQCLSNLFQHVPIYLQQFSSYSNCKCKKSPFSRTAAHIFVSPGDAPATITQYVAWMERQLNACQTPRSIYLSVFNSFRVIRCWIQCVSPKIAIFITFLFPLGSPLGQSRYMLYGWKDNSMLTNCLAACTHVSSTVFQLFELQVQKIAVFTYCSPNFCFPWRRPRDYHAICCMDGKTIQWLPNPSQHLPICLQ